MNKAFEILGGGRIHIPIPHGKWVAPAVRGENPKKKPFVLTDRHKEWIKQYSDQPWIARASREPFWICLECGWKPWPTDRGDDVIWPWISALPWRSYFRLLILTRRIRALEREVAKKPPFSENKISMEKQIANADRADGTVQVKW